MQLTDEMIRSGLRQVVDQARPADNLWERVEQGIGRRRRPPLAIMAAALTAVCLLVVSLPGPRALAVETVKAIFTGTLGDMEIRVVEDSPIGRTYSRLVEILGGGGPVAISVADQPAARFTGAPGEFPAEAREVIQSPFRIPAWIPEGMSVEVLVQPGAGSDDQIVTFFIGGATGAVISQRTLLSEDVTIFARSDATAQTLLVHGVKVLEVENEGRISYYFSVDGVLIMVSGDKREQDMVSSLVEGLLR